MRLARAGRWVVYWLATIAVVLYVIHWRWVRHLSRRDRTRATLAAKDVPASLYRAVGWFESSPRRHLEGLQPAANRVRIITLGDSFTFGAEVVDGLDYPSLLRRRLAERYDNVDVINLGVSGFGLGQSLQLFDGLGRAAQPDFVLYGPKGMWTDRDETFLFDGMEADAIHGRYVLDGDGVRFVGPAGDDADAIFDGYYRFIPRLDYLRYDRQAPPITRALLPSGRSVDNPFYYSKLNREDEGRALYRRMVAKLLDGPYQTLVVVADADAAALVGDATGRAPSLTLDALPSNIYNRSRYHFSGAGNQYVASLYLQMLDGAESLGHESVSFSEGAAAATAPLPRAHRIILQLAGKRAAQAVYRPDFKAGNGDTAVDFAAAGIESVVALRWGDGALVDAVQIPLSEPLPLGAAVELVLQTPTGESRLSLGTVSATALPSWGSVKLPADVDSRQGKLWFNRQCARGAIIVAGKTVVELSGAHNQLEEPIGVTHRVFYLWPLQDDLLDVEALPTSGDVDVLFDAAPLRIGGYTKKRVTTPWPRDKLRKWIAPAPDNARRAIIVSR